MATRTTEDWLADDGARLHVAHVVPRRVRANLLLVHGFAEHGGRYDDLIDALAAHDVATQAVDLRGHGRSDGVRGLVRDASRLVDDVALLLERLQAESGPVALFGHSFGGAIAARAAQVRPDLLDALVLSSPYLLTALKDPPWVLRAADALSHVLPRLRTKVIDADVISSLPEEVRRYREDPLVDHGGVRLASSRELHALGRVVLDDVERLVTPTLIVHGDADGLADVTGSRRLASRMVASDVTLRVIEGGHHELLHDAGAGKVRSGIVDWLLDRLGLAAGP